MQTELTPTASASQEAILSIANKNTQVVLEYRDMVLEQYKQRNWLDTDHQLEGVVFDKFDNVSDLLVVQSGDEIVAGMRIVRDSSIGFPHESLLGLDQFTPDGYYEDPIRRKLANTPRDQMGEITKLAGKKRKRFLTYDLAKLIYWYAKQNSIEIYLMVVDLEFFVLCDKLGIPITPIGVPVQCEGSWTIPAVIDPDQFEVSIPEKSPNHWAYISHKENLDATWGDH